MPDQKAVNIKTEKWSQEILAGEEIELESIHKKAPAEVRSASGNDQLGPKQAPLTGKLLIVDDNEMNRDMLSRRLRRQGHTVAEAINGMQALRMVKREDFDLILLDIMMPEINGYQVLEQLKADLSLPYIPVIMITAVDNLSSLVRCIELGAEDYLSKPFNPVLLQARIGASLEKKRLRDRQDAYTRQLNVENQRKSDELEKARDIQLAMLPANPPEISFLSIAAHQETASEVGGDYYDFFPQPDGTLFVTMGDATGHGVSSGLMVAMTKASLLTTEETHLPALIAQVNQVLNKVDLGLQLNMALMVLKIVKLENGAANVKIAGGGMPPIYLLRGDGSLEEMMISGLPLGIFDNAGYCQTEFKMQSGDTLVLTSDGLMEIFNHDHQFLGVDRLKTALAQIDCAALSIDETLAAVANIGKVWANGHPLYDDITLVVIRAN